MAGGDEVQRLTERCRAQMDDFHSDRPSDEQPCLELFRLALIEGDQTAWEAIYDLYRTQVMRWVQNHPRFYFTGEEAGYFVNQAFWRLWKYGARHARAGRFGTVADYLQYLKRCAASVITDELRRGRSDALSRLIELAGADDDDSGGPAVPPGQAGALLHDRPPLEEEVEREIVLSDLWALLRQVLDGERERLLAEEIWGYGLSPQQVYALHPDQFADEEEVSQIRRNIVRRLNRQLTNSAQHQRLRDALRHLLGG
jgi:hypothetical protein